MLVGKRALNHDFSQEGTSSFGRTNCFDAKRFRRISRYVRTLFRFSRVYCIDAMKKAIIPVVTSALTRNMVWRDVIMFCRQRSIIMASFTKVIYALVLRQHSMGFPHSAWFGCMHSGRDVIEKT